MKEFSKTNYHYFFFITLFIIQITIFRDYGFANDEAISRFNGLVSYNYIIDKFNLGGFQLYPNIPKLENYTDKDYGVIFELLLVVIEKILDLKETRSIYLSRHFVVSTIFFIGCIFFYLTLRKFFSKKISLLGTLIFFTHPRIFAQSFYNSKDIVFLVLFCISNYFFINYFLKQNFKNILFLSIFIALAICIRPMALIIPFLFIFFFTMQNLDRENFRKFILVLPFIFFTSIFTFLFWPYLWDDPSRIFEVLGSMSKFRWVGEVFFNGEYHVAKYMPWDYIPTMILTTSPIFLIVIFLVGLFVISKNFLFNLIKLKFNNENIWKNEIELFLFYSLCIIFLTIGLIIELSATIYNGWRQIYFIYPSIVFVSIFGLNYLLKFQNYRRYTFIFIFLSLLFNCYSLIKNHPYQYTFYNSIITNKNIRNFELDYYGVSNLDILKKLSSISDKKIYKIYVFSNNLYYLSLNMMSENEKKKYQFVNKIEEADFILTNHYYQDYYFKEKNYLTSNHPAFVEDYLNNKFDLLYEIKSNGVRINSIYIKKK